MNALNIFFIASSVFGLVVGLLGLRKILYPGQLTFVKENSLALFDSLAKSFADLTIQYKDKPVNQGLVFLKGSILNTGTKDINAGMIEDGIKINLPEKFQWLSAKIISASPSLQAELIISGNSIHISTKLFRCKEFIRFEALAEVPITSSKKDSDTLENKLEKAIQFTHRIADTQKILMKDLPKSGKEYELPKVVFVAAFFPIILFFIGLIVVSFIGGPVKTNFIIKNDKNAATEVEIFSIRNGQLKLRGISDKSFKKTMSRDEFLNQQELKPVLVSDLDIKSQLLILIPANFFC